jgi:hypothetical protein
MGKHLASEGKRFRSELPAGYQHERMLGMSQSETSRRTIIRGAAWGVPVMAIAIAAPAVSASALQQLQASWVVNPGYPRYSGNEDDDFAAWETNTTLTITNVGSSMADAPITVTFTPPNSHFVSNVSGELTRVGDAPSPVVLQSALPISPGGSLSATIFFQIYTLNLVPDTKCSAVIQVTGYPSEMVTLKIDYPDHYT